MLVFSIPLFYKKVINITINITMNIYSLLAKTSKKSPFCKEEIREIKPIGVTGVISN